MKIVRTSVRIRFGFALSAGLVAVPFGSVCDAQVYSVGTSQGQAVNAYVTGSTPQEIYFPRSQLASGVESAGLDVHTIDVSYDNPNGWVVSSYSGTSANAGNKKLSAFAQARSMNGQVLSNGQAYAGMQDQVRLYAPDHELGEICVVAYAIKIHGTLLGSAEGFGTTFRSDATLSAAVNPNGFNTYVFSGFLSNTGSTPLDEGVRYLLARDVVNGSYYDLRAELTVQAVAGAMYYPNTADALAFYSNTIEWMGVTAVTDSLGNPVTNFTFEGASGIDWKTGVPEPTGLCLLAPLALGLRRRARC